MWTLLAVVLVQTVYSRGVDVQLPPNCELPLDRGTDCNNSTIRFYMDKEKLQCMPFKYNGCGGNENNFASASECSRCLPMDLLFCPDNSDSVKRADGNSFCDETNKCPSGATCRRGFVVGLCCDNEIIKKSASDENPSCPAGKTPYKTEKYGFQMLHIGKSCDHDFCPRGSSCHQGEYVSYCCI